MMTREEIASIIIVSGGILGGMFFFDGDAFVRFLLEENKIAFRVFGIAFVALILITVIMYSRTMKVDIYDEMPTAATLKVIKVNIVIWCIFWGSWSVFNVMALFHYPIYMKVLLFSFLLANIPGIAFFLFALSCRKDERELLPVLIADANTPEEAALCEKLVQLRYFVAAYGIITVPVYLVGFVVGSLIK